MPITRRELRRSVAHMLDDYALATDAAGGFTNQLTDLVSLARESGFFQGMQLYFSNPASPHYGMLATVTNSDGPNRTIFFEPPLPSETIPGEQVEMYNFAGRGSTKSQYDRSIHDAVEIARENHALIPLVVAGTDPFSRRSSEVQIPASFVAFSYLRFDMRDGHRNLPPKQIRVDRLTRTVTVLPRYADAFHGRTFAFVGYGEQPLPQTDDDEIAVDAEWMYNEVKAQILERLVASGANIGSYDRLYLQERNESGGKRPLIVARALPNTIRLWS